jgi:hypothetical protein
VFNINGALGGNRPVTRDEPRQVARWDAKAQSEAFSSAARKLLCVRGEVHMDLPSGSFMHEFTINVYQVKVISLKGNKGFN